MITRRFALKTFCTSAKRLVREVFCAECPVFRKLVLYVPNHTSGEKISYTFSEYKGISCLDKRSATRHSKNCKITRCPWNCVDDSFIAWRWMHLLHKVKVDLGTGNSELWWKHNFETYLENHKNWGKHMLNVVLTAVMVLTSQTLMVPSKEAVANKSGLSGLNLQSNIVSIWP